MKMDRLDELIAAAQSAGILPASATRPESDGKPWPLVLMVGLGAWLSAIPLLGFLAFVGGRSLYEGGSAWTLGVVLIGAAVWTFRSDSTSIFVEQLGLPVLLAGCGLIWLGMVDDMKTASACLILAVVTAVVSVLVPRAWLRVLLGAFACSLVTFEFLLTRGAEYDLLWTGAHATLLTWLAANVLRRSLRNGGPNATLATTVESAGAGWLTVTLFSLAAWSGATFMIGAAFGFGSGGTAGPGSAHYMEYRHLSAAAAACGAAWLAKNWPAVRNAPALIVAVVLAGLSWLNPTLGATFLALACCMVSGRWRLASAATIAAAWIIGAFYYQLSLPLASKALVMLGAAATLGGVAWLTSPKTSIAPPVETPRPTAARNFHFFAIALSGVAVLIVVNTGIWQKERLIAHSRSVFVELAPVDPRSIMQGDYMALKFRLPNPIGDESRQCPDDDCKAVAKVDGRGVVTMSRLSTGQALAEGEFVIELTRRAGHWTMVTDAWHFKEGEAERWSKAKYGEFRVDSNGRAMLVGMRGPNLEVL